MPLILGTNSIKDTGFNVANSLRFNSGDSAYLNFSPSSTGNRRTFTISFWFKVTNSGSTTALFSTGNYSGGDGYLQINLSSSGRLVVDDYDQGGGSYNLRWVTPSAGPLFRDPTAFNHFVLAVDSTQGTQSNRAKIYINGLDISSDFTQTSSTSQNDDFHVNTSGKVQQIGRSQNNNNYNNGYIAEFVMIDGLQLAPTSFGEFDEDSPNIWKPIDVSGLTFGTNGFYLDFENSGSLGNDKAGSNNFTVNNLTAIDQSTDTCTNNFCTLNPLTLQDTDFVLSEGNLKISIGGNNERKAVLGTFGLTSGKWYWEVKYTSTTGPSYAQIGISDIIEGTEASTENGKMGYFPYDYGYRGEHSSGNGLKTNNGSFTSYGDGWTTGDIIGVALDLDNNAIYFSKNGTWQASGDPTSGASRTNATFNITAASSTGTGAYFPAIGKEDVIQISSQL